MKIKILLITLFLSSCAVTPKGNFAITTYDSSGEIKKEYFVNSYDQGVDGVTIKVDGKPVKITNSFKIEKIKQ